MVDKVAHLQWRRQEVVEAMAELFIEISEARSQRRELLYTEKASWGAVAGMEAGLGGQVARMRAQVVTERILEVEASITRLVGDWGKLNRERAWLKGLEFK